MKDREEREGERRDGLVREEIPFYDHSFIESTSAEILKRGNCDTASSPRSKPPNESRHPMTIQAFSEPALINKKVVRLYFQKFQLYVHQLCLDHIYYKTMRPKKKETNKQKKTTTNSLSRLDDTRITTKG